MTTLLRRIGLTVGIVLAATAAVAQQAPRVVVLPDSGPVLVTPAPARAATVATLEDEIDACVRAGMQATNAPGAAVAVLLDGAMLHERGYGVRRRGGSAPVTPDTIFRIGSVTKMMTAAAVLQLVEAGAVRLDAPVTDYIPELAISGRWPASAITVRHLLTHASGWPDRFPNLGPAGEDALSRWPASQGGIALHAPPGAFWNYSNPNYILAGLVAERASGVRYRTLMEQSLWAPAGMSSTTFDPAQAMAGGNYASGTAWNVSTAEWVTLEPDEVESWQGGPAGWAMSTVGDLVAWAEVLMQGGAPVLDPASAEAMQGAQQWCHFSPSTFYGYGVLRDRYHGLDVLFHDGSVIGWGATLLWVPEERFAVAVLSNTATPMAEAAFCTLDAVLDPPVSPGWDPRTAAESWRPFEGSYEMSDYLGRRYSGRVSIDWALRRLALDVTRGGPVIPAGRYLLSQIERSTFVADTGSAGFGLVDLTFIEGPHGPSPVRWMRYRYAVGDRQPAARTPTARRP